MNRFPAIQPWLSTLARLVLAGVWLYAGVEKFIHTEDTVRAVRAFQILPETFVRPWAYGMPLIEIILGALLLIGLTTRWAAVGTAVMMIIFIGGIASAWYRGLPIDCGCFGGGGVTEADPVPGFIRDILRDLLYLGLAVFLIRWPTSKFSLDGVLGLNPAPAVAADSDPGTPDHRTNERERTETPS